MTQASSRARPCPPMAARSWFDVEHETSGPRGLSRVGRNMVRPRALSTLSVRSLTSRNAEGIHSKGRRGDAVFSATAEHYRCCSDCAEHLGLGRLALKQSRGIVPCSDRCTARRESRSWCQRAAERWRTDASSAHRGLGRCCREEPCRCRIWRGANHTLSCP